VRAKHDPVWTADGYVSDRWRPVSPVSGRLDAFQWQTPLAALPSDRNVTVEATAFEEAMLAPPTPEPAPAPTPPAPDVPIAPETPASQDNSPAAAGEATAQPAFRSRQDFAKTSPPAVPPVIPIVRPPDDPGIEDEPRADEFAEPTEPARSQAGGWRGFLSRWGG
jgi:HemY protein